MLFCSSSSAGASKEHLAIPPSLYWLLLTFRFVLHMKQITFLAKGNFDLVKDTGFCSWISPWPPWTVSHVVYLCAYLLKARWLLFKNSIRHGTWTSPKASLIFSIFPWINVKQNVFSSIGISISFHNLAAVLYLSQPLTTKLRIT